MKFRWIDTFKYYYNGCLYYISKCYPLSKTAILFFEKKNIFLIHISITKKINFDKVLYSVLPIFNIKKMF